MQDTYRNNHTKLKRRGSVLGRTMDIGPASSLDTLVRLHLTSNFKPNTQPHKRAHPVTRAHAQLAKMTFDEILDLTAGWSVSLIFNHDGKGIHVFQRKESTSPKNVFR